ncbi:MAG: orotidine-5'-phosphate decarboxylase [Candidatus Nitrospinota bacterium M3_3B_026]
MSDKAEAAKDRLIAALDVATPDEARSAAEKLSGTVGWFKVGSELFTAAGPGVVEELKSAGAKVFLDLKFHDIPNTAAAAARAAAALGVDMLNVHAMGGLEMMRRTVESVAGHCEREGLKKPLVVAVTVLTSMGREDLRGLGIDRAPGEVVLELAALAKRAGLDGVVASAREVKAVKERLGPDFLTVTPGVRPEWAAAGDQKRIATPAGAVRDGADFLVVGRPILEAADQAAAARKILEEMEAA